MINLGDKQISDIKLGATNVVSVYQGDTLIWPPREPSILVYTTTSANQIVILTGSKQCFEYIETEDGVEDLSESGTLNHTFVNVGEHKVKVLFKKGLTDFSNCFGNCSELTSIPSNLFANNTKVTNFSYCLQYCRELTSSTPLDNDGTPLYNRSEGKEGYSVVNSHKRCFYNCTLMSDYSSIPSDWK